MNKFLVILTALIVLIATPVSSFAHEDGNCSNEEITDVNIYQDPDSESLIIGTIQDNTDVTIDINLCNDEWDCIVLESGINGYIPSGFIADNKINCKNNVSNRWNISLTEEEIDTVARIVMLEAEGESDEGQQAVVEVIFNRVVDPDFPDTVIGVLGEKRQFSTWKNRNSNRAEPNETVLKNVHMVMNGETDILPFETVYFSRKAQNKRVQTTIGGHVFCNKK